MESSSSSEPEVKRSSRSDTTPPCPKCSRNSNISCVLQSDTRAQYNDFLSAVARSAPALPLSLSRILQKSRVCPRSTMIGDLMDVYDQNSHRSKISRPSYQAFLEGMPCRDLEMMVQAADIE